MKHARRIGLVSAAALVIANMIGTGVFTTSGFALADLGSPELVILAWLIGGLLALCGAVSYGALARYIPESGGEYTFLYRTIHPLAGFLAGWVSLLAGFTAPIAAAGLGLQAYLAGSFGWTLRPEWIGTCAILLAGLMHGIRLEAGTLLQNTAVALKLFLITGLITFAFLHMPSHEATASLAPTDFDLGAFSVTLVWISFAYSGWNAAVYIGGEVVLPERNLFRSLVLATLVVTVLYLGLNAVFLYAAPADAIAGKAEVGAIAAEALGGPFLRRIVSTLVALALFTSISSMVMAGSRVYEQMAEDGLLPPSVGIGRDAPSVAVALQVAGAILVVWISDLAQLLSYIGFTLGVSAAATVGALILLRRREGPQSVPIPGFPWIPALFVGATLAISLFMAASQPWQAGVGLMTVAAGVPFYWLAKLALRPKEASAPR
jgi:APA family basic amino acid/polyamine antiporter